MNFLAHIHLSGNNELVKIGNFMADGIRGKTFTTFAEDIQKGIVLHRAIDSFTDSHPVFRQSTKRLHEKYHHYAGVIVDMFYDHFLAKNWNQFSEDNLELFAAQFYDSLQLNYDLLSPKAQSMLPYLVQYNWLVSYKSVAGLERILTQMDKRTQNQSQIRFATIDLLKNYDLFESEFFQFYKEVQIFAIQKLNEIENL